jgi:hypothetical protein
VSNGELSRIESELRESAVEGDSKKGIRLCQEDLVCELTILHVLQLQ